MGFNFAFFPFTDLSGKEDFMFNRGFSFALCAAVFAAIFVSAAPARAEVPIEIEETWTINLGYFMAKVEKIFFSGQFAEKHPEAAKVKLFLDKTGILGLREYSGEFRIKNGELYWKELYTIADSYKSSLKGQMMALPDRQLKVGKIINPSSALLTISLANPAEKAEIVWNAISDETLWNEIESLPGGGGEIAQIRMGIGMANMMLGGMGGFESVKEIVGTEATVMLVELPEGDMASPGYKWDDMVALFALAIDDENAFKKNYLSQFGNLASAKPSFTAGGINYYDVEPGIIAGLGGGFFVVGTNAKRLQELLKSNKPDIKPVTSNFYFRMDVNRVWHKHFEPMTRGDKILYPAYATAMHKEFWDVTPQTNFGALEMTCSNGPKGMAFEMKGRAELVNLFGAVYTWGFAALAYSDIARAKMQPPPDAEIPAEDSWMRESAEESLMMIQEAVEYFYEDNGTYPRTIEALIEQEYFEEFPSNPYNSFLPMQPRYLTDFAPGDFVYIPVYTGDRFGGYFLLLFGGDRYGGMDVVSAKNAFPGQTWAPEGDGKPDGIVLILESGEDNGGGGE